MIGIERMMYTVEGHIWWQEAWRWEVLLSRVEGFIL